MLSGLTVNSIRFANSAANSPEKLTSTISTPGRPRRFAISLTMSTPNPSGPPVPRTIQGAMPKSDPTTRGFPVGWSDSCARNAGAASEKAIASPTQARRALIVILRRYDVFPQSAGSSRGVMLHPVSRDVDPSAKPNIGLGQDVIEEAFKPDGAARMAGESQVD